VEQGGSVWVGLDKYKVQIAVAVASLGRAETPAGEAVRAAKQSRVRQGGGPHIVICSDGVMPRSIVGQSAPEPGG
jgi:hypothetical protein